MSSLSWLMMNLTSLVMQFKVRLLNWYLSQQVFSSWLFRYCCFCHFCYSVSLFKFTEIGNTNVEFLHHVFFIFATDLQDTPVVLDFRVTVLEENGGGDGNSSVAELEVRVETLEGTAADHETRLSAAESDINGKSFKKFETICYAIDCSFCNLDVFRTFTFYIF